MGTLHLMKIRVASGCEATLFIGFVRCAWSIAYPAWQALLIEAVTIHKNRIQILAILYQLSLTNFTLSLDFLLYP